MRWLHFILTSTPKSGVEPPPFNTDRVIEDSDSSIDFEIEDVKPAVIIISDDSLSTSKEMATLFDETSSEDMDDIMSGISWGSYIDPKDVMNLG